MLSILVLSIIFSVVGAVYVALWYIMRESKPLRVYLLGSLCNVVFSLLFAVWIYFAEPLQPIHHTILFTLLVAGIILLVIANIYSFHTFRAIRKELKDV